MTTFQLTLAALVAGAAGLARAIATASMHGRSTSLAVGRDRFDLKSEFAGSQFASRSQDKRHSVGLA